MTDHTDLIAQLNNGWVARPKRWSGDTHHDFPYGNLDDKATDLLMEEAASLAVPDYNYMAHTKCSCCGNDEWGLK